MEEIDPQ